MAVEGGNNIVWFTYTGQEEIPDEATHIIVDVRTIPAEAFRFHPLIEVICLDRVEKIEQYAFHRCRRLKRVIMPGVKIVEKSAQSLRMWNVANWK